MPAPSSLVKGDENEPVQLQVIFIHLHINSSSKGGTSHLIQAWKCFSNTNIQTKVSNTGPESQRNKSN